MQRAIELGDVEYGENRQLSTRQDYGVKNNPERAIMEEHPSAAVEGMSMQAVRNE